MAKKKKTMVMMPGAMTDLAHSVQKGARPAPTTNAEETTTDGQEANEPVQYDTGSVEQEVRTQVEEQQAARFAEPAQTVEEPIAPAAQTSQFGRVEPKQEATDRKDRTAPAAKKLPKAEGRQLAREYSLAKDSGEDSWQIFLDLARDYKARDSRLATVYIDSDLKGVLDRLKSATSVKLPSTALLSAIVARFVFEHEKDIKNAIFGESLL
ncbi:hypothetical protein J5A56_03065 [Prevotella melaninogenica]|uniref:hypothetical protein n=1 Tax=Prevotella TaxID=838 RepID=UPI0003AD47CC|nr:MULTISPECIES: hypothetical protein [Prevotella]ERJ76820.1 hypothetical protein HMPREF9148_01626 [Prevotella sp. F0091]QUB72327.1 hypothetical protein J5A56_03065 [Prevotella melaninogenica]